MYDHTAQRLFVDAPLAAGQSVAIDQGQANYLLNVLRLGPDAAIHVFNGRDGEWLARIAERKKKSCTLAIETLLRPQENGPDIDYLFAPIKHARLDYMVQKATELGVARLRPVITRRTIAERVNLDRMRANAIEAAEQCGILRIPEVLEPVKLDKVLAVWDVSRKLIFCDEAATVANPIQALREGVRPYGSDPVLKSTATQMGSDPQGQTPGRVQALREGGRPYGSDPVLKSTATQMGSDPQGQPPRRASLAVLIGPEGGFDPAERELLMRQPFTLAISLGPRIMRADTAAVAALAIINAAVGDWG